jgi:DNA-binding NarL/FixJ family response regulator
VTLGLTPASHLRVVAALLRLIIVDDDPAVLRSFKRAIKVRRPAWEVTTVSDSQQAIEYLEDGNCDVLVTDYEMPDLNGVQLLSKVQEQWPSVRRVILSGKPADLAEFSPQSLVQAWVRKAWGADELIAVVEDLVAESSLLENRQNAL